MIKFIFLFICFYRVVQVLQVEVDKSFEVFQFQFVFLFGEIVIVYFSLVMVCSLIKFLKYGYLVFIVEGVG